jgi:hypothetical protein
LPTEIEIRNAIAARIKATAPTAVVIPRDVVNALDGTWLSLLEDDNGKVHGWVVTLESMPLTEDRGDSAEYDLRFSVWRFLDYDTGDDAANSEDQGSVERAAVVTAFARRSTLPAVLSNCSPLEFGRTAIRYVGDKCVHIDEGTITSKWVTDCS